MSRYDRLEEVEKGIDTIEEVKKFNPYHGKDGRFSSKGGGGGIAGPMMAPDKGGAAGGAGGGTSVLSDLSGVPNNQVPGKKVKISNGGGTVTMGRMMDYDGFGNDKIKRGEEYAIKSIARGTVKVGTYNGIKSSKLGGSHSFTGRDGKSFSVEADNTFMNPIYEVK